MAVHIGRRNQAPWISHFQGIGGQERQTNSIKLPDIEAVAAKVHESWMAEKEKKGIASRKAENGEELMVPYGRLSEPQKDQDRQTVKTVYAAIRELSKGDK